MVLVRVKVSLLQVVHLQIRKTGTIQSRRITIPGGNNNKLSDYEQ